MPRGVVPRQPARTGRQDKVRVARAPSPAKSRPVRPPQAAGPIPNVSQTLPKGSPPGSKRRTAPGKPTKGYNPIAPERVTEILKRLNETYPDVTCALTHASAWELLVATILSAQSTDVN